MTLVNGEKESQVSIFDRGLCYGDGFFETFFYSNGTLQNWSYHWARMVKSADILRMTLPDPSVFFADLESLEKKIDTDGNCVVKIVITRGVGGRGYSPSSCKVINRLMYSDSLPDYKSLRKTGVDVSLLNTRLEAEGKIAGLKHLNRLNQIMAKMELEERDTREGILCNQDGYVREGVSSNIFIIKNQSIITPPLNDCGVAGVLRSKVIHVSPKYHTPVIEKNFTIEELLDADEVFFTNSLLGVCPVTSIEGETYNVGNITQKLMSLQLEADVTC